MNARLLELFGRVADSTATPEEVRELDTALCTDAALRREFLRYLNLDAALMEAAPALHAVRLPSGMRWRRWAITAAAAAVAVSSFVWRLLPGAETVLTVESVQGEVWVQRGGTKHLVTGGFSMRPGDVLQTSLGGGVVATFPDRSATLRVEEETSLRVPERGQPFAMDQGGIAATVKARSKDNALVFSTPQGTARVLGTVFRLVSAGAVTQLEVTEGKVELSGGGTKAEVGAQRLGVVGDDLPLAVRAVERDGDGIGLLGEYFPGKQFNKAAFTRVDAQVQFDWGLGDPAPHLHGDHFQVRWSGMLLPRYSGRHLFEIVADDGARLWVDGKLLIDQWSIRSRQTRMSGEVDLTAGRAVELRLEYFEASKKAFVSLYWQSDLQRREIVPRSQLFPASP